MLSRLFGGAVEQLTRGLAFASARHTVLSHNIANAETPGYRARDLVFDDFLRPAMEAAAGDPPVRQAGLGPGGRRPRLVAMPYSGPMPDGGPVHLDQQMARLAENTLYQHALVQVLASRFNSMKQAISGRV